MVPRNRGASKKRTKTLNLQNYAIFHGLWGKNFPDDDPQLGKYFRGTYCLAVEINHASYICIILPPGGVAHAPIQKCPIFAPLPHQKLGVDPNLTKTPCGQSE